MDKIEKIRAEIKRLITDPTLCSTTERKIGGHTALLKLVSFIDSLQQEQPEVDLEKEVRIYCGSSFRFNYDELNDSFYSNAFEFDDVVELARHFYELGLNSK